MIIINTQEQDYWQVQCISVKNKLLKTHENRNYFLISLRQS
jgi:hypothetical protein